MPITFLPYPDFKASAACLDNKRLGKQRAEALMLLNALDDLSHGYYNANAAKMWRGYRNALVEYGLAICQEWIDRGKEDSTAEKIAQHRIPGPTVMPSWFGNNAVHASHRAALLSKLPEWYGYFGWKDSPLLPYYWPI